MVDLCGVSVMRHRAACKLLLSFNLKTFSFATVIFDLSFTHLKSLIPGCWLRDDCSEVTQLKKLLHVLAE